MIDKEYQVVGVVVLSVLLLGLFGCGSSTPSVPDPAEDFPVGGLSTDELAEDFPVVESFEVSVVTSEEWLFPDEHYITLKYLGEGELRNVELIITVTFTSAEFSRLRQFKGSWNTNETLQIGNGSDLSIERVEMQGFAYRDGERVRIVHSGLIASKKTFDELYEDL